MSKEDWIANPIHKVLYDAGLWKFNDGEIESVLDIACGLSLKSQYIIPTPKIIVGVDIYEPYLKKITSKVPYVAIKYDVRKIKDIFIDNSFDVVYAIDILEHLRKKDSLYLIECMKRIARRAVVVETPKGYIPQNIDILHMGGDKYQTHRSSWDIQEFTAMGFEYIIRKYKMQDVQRHSRIEVNSNVELITSIYRKDIK